MVDNAGDSGLRVDNTEALGLTILGVSWLTILGVSGLIMVDVSGLTTLGV